MLARPEIYLLYDEGGEEDGKDIKEGKEERGKEWGRREAVVADENIVLMRLQNIGLSNSSS